MVGTFEVSKREFKTTKINMQRALLDKVGIIKEQMGNISREMVILRATTTKMLEIKNTVTELKNAFHDMAQGYINGNLQN